MMTRLGIALRGLMGDNIELDCDFGGGKRSMTMVEKLENQGQGWGVQDSYNLYEMSGWGDGYVGVNEAGHVEILPEQGEGYGLI